MDEPKISLMIYGTRIGQVGWEPQVILNNPPFSALSNPGVMGVGDNPTYYTFRIDRDYTQFTLAYNPKCIKAYQSIRNGALKVSISIPKGYVLDNGVTPYNVLQDLKRTLETLALSPIEGVPGSYSFKPEFPDEKIFAEIINAFSLRPADVPHRPMSGTSALTGMILLDYSRLDDLLRDVQYPEFGQYKEIVVASQGNSENLIQNLEIPRPHKYEIFFKKTGVPNSERNITSQLLNYTYGLDDSVAIDIRSQWGADRRAYVDKIYKFTVNELLHKTKPAVSGVTFIVNSGKEEVLISAEKPEKKRESKKIQVSGVSKNDVYNYLRVTVNGVNRTIRNDNTIELVGEEITAYPLGLDIKVSLKDGDKYHINGKIDQKIDSIVIPVKEKEKPKQKESIDLKKIKTSKGIYEENECNACSFRLILQDEEDIESEESFDCWVSFKGNPHSFRNRCKFQKETDKKTSKSCWVAMIDMPLSWKGDYKINFRTNVAKYAGDDKSYRLPEDVTISGNQTDKLGWRDKINAKTRRMLGMLIVFLLGLGLGIGGTCVYSSCFKHTSQPGESEEVGIYGNQEVVQSGVVDTGISDTAKIQEWKNVLSDSAVSFAQIHELYNQLDSMTSRTEELNELLLKVQAYDYMAKFLEEDRGQFDWDKAVVFARNSSDDIDPVHMKYLARMWSSGKNRRGEDVLFDNNQKRRFINEINKVLPLTSFAEIPDIDITVSESGGTVNVPRHSTRKKDNVDGASDGNARW